MKCWFQNLLGKLLHQLHARIDSVHFKTPHQVLPVQTLAVTLNLLHLAGIPNFRPGIAVSLMIWIGLQCRHRDPRVEVPGLHLHQKTLNSALTAQSHCHSGAKHAVGFYDCDQCE